MLRRDLLCGVPFLLLFFVEEDEGDDGELLLLPETVELTVSPISR